MRFIRPLDYFLRAYSPMRLLRDFLRNHPAYRGADYVTPPPKMETRPTVYTNETYENTQPNFSDEDQLYIQQREMDDHLSQLHTHMGRQFQASQHEDMSNADAEEHSHLSDAERIDMAIEAVKDGLIPIGFEHDPADTPPSDQSHRPDIAHEERFFDPADALFGEPFEGTLHDPEAAADDDPYAEPFDAPFDEPFDPEAVYPFFQTLDDRVEGASGDVAEVQDDMYDDPYAEQSLDDMMDDPMDEPDDMPEPEPEPEPMDPMDDPLHPYMPYGGFFFPGG